MGLVERADHQDRRVAAGGVGSLHGRLQHCFGEVCLSAVGAGVRAVAGGRCAAGAEHVVGRDPRAQTSGLTGGRAVAGNFGVVQQQGGFQVALQLAAALCDLVGELVVAAGQILRAEVVGYNQSAAQDLSVVANAGGCRGAVKRRNVVTVDYGGGADGCQIVGLPLEIGVADVLRTDVRLQRHLFGGDVVDDIRQFFADAFRVKRREGVGYDSHLSVLTREF